MLAKLLTALRKSSRWNWYLRLVVVPFLVVAGFLGLWLTGKLWFDYQFGRFLPSGVSASTPVISVTWPMPSGVPKTNTRQIREFFGYYYPEHSLYGRWTAHFPKTLSDVLDEYGAHVHDGKLCDASGREMRIIKKSVSDSAQAEWEMQLKELINQQCTMVIVDIPENE